jgi:tetratricopeptide (TPR) repeat protein
MKGGFIWDDEAYVSQNPTLLTVEGLWQNWFSASVHYQYYPLVLTTFWIEYRLWGLNPLGYHVVNVLIHAMNALLLWTVLRRLRIRWAWVAAAIFALHPVEVESVAWITERKNVLSLFFYLLAALSYLRLLGFSSRESISAKATSGASQSSAVPQRNWWHYGVALCFFMAALLSKTVTATFPVAILLILYWKRGRISRHDFTPLIPFFLLGIAMGLFTAWVEKHMIQAQGEEWSLTLLERFLLAGRVLWFYASKLLLPLNLMFFYPRWHVSQAVWWQYIYPAGALLVIWCLWWLRGRLGRGPLVAVLFFAGTLFPALGFFNVYPMRYSFVADHFQYHASIGLIVLAAVLLKRIAELGEAKLRRFGEARLQRLLGVALLLVLGFLTWRQGSMYTNLETLWRTTIARNPAAWMAHSNLALLLEDQEHLDEALEHAQRALELRPHDAIMKHNVANMLFDHGEYEKAAEMLRGVLSERPDLAPAHSLLGWTLTVLGQYDEAEPHLRKAIELDPSYVHGWKGMAQLLVARGNYEASLPYFEHVLGEEPRNVPFILMAAQACEALGRRDQATALYQIVLEIQPNEPQAREGLARLSQH